MYKNWLAERGEALCAGCESRRLIPSRDIRTPSMINSKMQPAC